VNVLILYGGRSTEHEVSLVSAAGVFLALKTLEPIEVQLVGIDRDGRWFLQDPERQMQAADETGHLVIETDAERAVVVVPGGGPAGGCSRATGERIPVDCVFPVLHGTCGEDGTIQGLLEIAGLPYVGSGVTGSAVGMDKLRAKQLWEQNGLPVVPYFAVRMDRGSADGSHRSSGEGLGRGPGEGSSQGLDRGPGGVANRLPARIVEETDAAIRRGFGYPVFVKPNATGSSIGISRVPSPENLAGALDRAALVDDVILVEQAFPVREIETAVLGNATVQTFPPGEVIPTHEFYDYEAKYTDPEGATLVIPADIPDDISQEIRSVSARAFLVVDAAGFSRVDSFIHRETGEIYLNEINTIPGFTPISMYPKMVQAGGVSYGELLGRLLELAIERAGNRANRNYHAR
jgi:D-alanine-D-alanine ligase